MSPEDLLKIVQLQEASSNRGSWKVTEAKRLIKLLKANDVFTPEVVEQFEIGWFVKQEDLCATK